MPGEGSYAVDSDRVLLLFCHAPRRFPDNTEMEAVVTLVGSRQPAVSADGCAGCERCDRSHAPLVYPFARRQL